MESLSRWVLRMINSDRYGGRTVLADDQTLILYDCGVWTDTHTQAVKNKFPECDIAVMQSQASLSGFIVVFRIHRDRSFLAWITATGVIFALFIVTARQMIVWSALS
jgi:hypothetical protein